MGKVSLNTVITEKFLTRLAAAGKQGGTTSANPFKSGNSSVSLSSTLRLGAQTYATAVQGLNNTLSLVNIAQGTLEQLGSITDKMIELADQAARRPVGPQGRRSLDVKFRALAEDFRKIIDKSEIGGTNFLSTDGLAELLMKVGLDRDSSESVAAIFEKFTTPEEDSALASERVKGARPLVIPASVFSTRPSGDEYQLRRLTDVSLNAGVGGISTNTSVFQTEDTFLFQNTGVDAVFTLSDTGTLTTQPLNALQGNSVTTLAVNDVTGYSIVKSTGDLLGFNPLLAEQLYLFDETGGIVGQLTANNTGTTSYTSADMADSDERFVVNSYDSDSGSYTVSLIDIPKGEAPNGTEELVIESGFEQLRMAKIDNRGEFLLYEYQESGGKRSPRLYDINNGSFDPGLSFTSVDPIEYGFLGLGGAVMVSRSVVAGLPEQEILSYSPNIGETAVLSGVVTEGFATVEGGDESGSGFFAIIEKGGDGTRTARVYSSTSDSEIYSFALGDDQVLSISAALNPNDSRRVDVGIFGALPAIVGDSDVEFYRIAYNPAFETGRRIVDSSAEFTEILDPARGLTSRPAAYRILNDLKALREQITTNVEALQNAFDVVAQNIELVRATGLALLEIGDALTNETDAASVAELLRRRIREQVPEALAQAENLDPIAVATLTYTGSGN